jgi:signal transduction histidine kinase/DNA-binding response OmpR family regulator
VLEIPSRRGEPGHILVVDDQAGNLLALDGILSPVGHTVVAARSGQEALRILMDQDFSVILLDVNMPVLDGFELAALIRSRGRTAETPIIFITAHSPTDDFVERGYALGAVDYIFSPVVPTILRAKVDVFVELHNRRKQLEQRGALLENTLRSLLSRLEVGVFRVDGDGYLTCMNESCSRLTGVPYAQKAQNQETEIKVLAEEAIPGFTEFVNEARPAGANGGAGVLRKELSIERHGQLNWVALSVSIEGNRQVEGMIEDIGPRKAAEHNLLRSNRDLEQFAYAASHDLRAPLRAIKDLASWLQQDLEGKLTGETPKYLYLLRKRVERMTMMLDGLLHYSRFSENPPGLGEGIDLNDLVKDVIDLLAPDQGMSIKVAPDLPQVAGSRPALQQVLMNLIGNSLKHHGGQNGKIWVSAADVGGRIEIAVRDDGPGIDPRFHQKVFQLFQTLRRRDELESSGIGLALVKKVVEQHGGAVSLESEAGAGATFRFTWPKVAPKG